MKVKVSVTQSCPTLCDSVDCSQWKSPRKNTGVGCRSLLQGIFLTQGSIPGLLHCREILHHLSHQGNPYIVSLLSAILTISLHSVAQGGGVFPGLSTQRRVPGPSLSHLSPGGATYLTLKNKVCRQKALSLKAPRPDSGGKSRSYGGQQSRSLEFGGSSIFSQAPEAPRLRLGPGWNPEQIQKCLRETGTEVGGEDPASDSPAREEAISNRPPLGLRPDSIGQVTPFPLGSYTRRGQTTRVANSAVCLGPL